MVKFQIENEDFYLDEKFASICGSFKDVYEFDRDNKILKLLPKLKTQSERTEAVQRVNLELRERGIITGWRDEYLPVVNVCSRPALLIERAATVHLDLRVLEFMLMALSEIVRAVR